jgi:hypothetical protein
LLPPIDSEPPRHVDDSRAHWPTQTGKMAFLTVRLVRVRGNKLFIHT